MRMPVWIYMTPGKKQGSYAELDSATMEESVYLSERVANIEEIDRINELPGSGRDVAKVVAVY